jgi:hypothetical protein
MNNVRFLRPTKTQKHITDELAELDLVEELCQRRRAELYRELEVSNAITEYEATFGKVEDRR